MSGRSPNCIGPYDDDNPVIYACQPWLRRVPVAPPPTPEKPPRLSRAQTERRRSVSSTLKSHHGKRCPYCGFIMIAEGHALDRGMRYPTRDHVVPRMRGGTAILIVCASCNAEKGGMMPDDFLERRSGCRRTLARIAMISALRPKYRSAPNR